MLQIVQLYPEILTHSMKCLERTIWIIYLEIKKFLRTSLKWKFIVFCHSIPFFEKNPNRCFESKKHVLIGRLAFDLVSMWWNYHLMLYQFFNILHLTIFAFSLLIFHKQFLPHWYHLTFTTLHSDNTRLGVTYKNIVKKTKFYIGNKSLEI